MVFTWYLYDIYMWYVHYREKHRHYSTYCHYWLFPSVPSEFTGTIADSRHYRGTSIVPWYALRCCLAIDRAVRQLLL